MIDNTMECVILTDNELEELIAKYGERFELDLLIEEMSELTKELIKMRRNCCVDHITREVCEEFVHVNFSLAVLRQIIARQDKLNKTSYFEYIHREAEEKAIDVKINYLGRSPYSEDINFTDNTHRKSSLDTFWDKLNSTIVIPNDREKKLLVMIEQLIKLCKEES